MILQLLRYLSNEIGASLVRLGVSEARDAVAGDTQLAVNGGVKTGHSADKDKPPRAIREPWRIEMKEALETKEGRAMHKLRKQTVEPAFGIVKSVLGFRNFRLRGLEKVKSEWSLVALAYTVTSLAKLRAETA